MGAADVTAGRTEKYREDCEKQVLCDDSILWNERNLWHDTRTTRYDLPVKIILKLVNSYLIALKSIQ